MFTLSDAVLNRLFEVNRFTVPRDEMVFFGLRGCLPIDSGVDDFASNPDLEIGAVDYRHPRCTLGQWISGDGLWLYPGSTVPHRRYIAEALNSDGRGTNCLMTGFYQDYRKGKHLAGKPTGHDAFRQNGNLPIRRSADNLSFDENDRVEYMAPADNLHAAWSMGPNHETFGSAGCQVVIGFARNAVTVRTSGLGRRSRRTPMRSARPALLTCCLTVATRGSWPATPLSRGRSNYALGPRAMTSDSFRKGWMPPGFRSV